MKATEKALENSLTLIDAITASETRKNVVGTLFMGAGITAFAIGLVIVMTKTE